MTVPAFNAHAAAGLEATFALYGVEATWTPVGGGPTITPVQVIKTAPGEDVELGRTGARVRMDTTTIEVRLSQVATVSRGDLVAITGGDTFKVLADPPTDDFGLVWVCEVKDVAV